MTVNSNIQVSNAVQATIIMAVITLALALFAVSAEAMEEDQAKMLVLPALYALILSSGITVATGTAGLIDRQQKIDSEPTK